ASAYARKRFKDSFNGSAWPVRKHSARPINITSSPVASMAARAARMRATASPKSYNGCEGSPVESSIDNPATPVSTQRLTFFFRPSMSRAWPSSKSAFTGRSVAATISRQCASTASISMLLSACARDHAKPELVVASALKPSAASACAEPASQGFGIRKQPDSCSLRNAARRADHFDVFIAPAYVYRDVSARRAKGPLIQPAFRHPGAGRDPVNMCEAHLNPRFCALRAHTRLGPGLRRDDD